MWRPPTELSAADAPQEVRGTVFAYDQQTQCVILQQSGSHGGVTNLRLLKQTAIKVDAATARLTEAMQEACWSTISCINESGSSCSAHLRDSFKLYHVLLMLPCVQEVLSAQRPSEPPDLQLPHVDIERARQREERALRVRTAAAEHTTVDRCQASMPCAASWLMALFTA